jgi:hypothetical protein
MVRPILSGLMLLLAGPLLADNAKHFPQFKTQEIATDLSIGYAVITADINADGKPDIVVLDKHRVLWYENPTWKPRIILTGKTKPDNVCITALDIDGNGDIELVVGAAWKPFDTGSAGTLQWLKRGKTLDEEWTLHPIPCEEPTVHRMRAIDLDGDGKPELVHVPLMGRDSTAKDNWASGRKVRVMAYKIPNEPTKPENWKPFILTESLSVMHNFAPANKTLFPGKVTPLLLASYEGVHLLRSDSAEKWNLKKLGDGNQALPKGSRGSSEIRQSMDKLGVIATIEPWHGNQVVVYAPEGNSPDKFQRIVIDEQLRWGHAVAFADLDSDGQDELVIGVRDDPNSKQGDTFSQRRGVRIYKRLDAAGTKWERLILDNGGVAVEDLITADLNGDGKPDIIAVGRATGNCRIYWNEGK